MGRLVKSEVDKQNQEDMPEVFRDFPEVKDYNPYIVSAIFNRGKAAGYREIREIANKLNQSEVTHEQ